jgi:hypothetical protein
LKWLTRFKATSKKPIKWAEQVSGARIWERSVTGICSVTAFTDRADSNNPGFYGYRRAELDS